MGQTERERLADLAENAAIDFRMSGGADVEFRRFQPPGPAPPGTPIGVQGILPTPPNEGSVDGDLAKVRKVYKITIKNNNPAAGVSVDIGVGTGDPGPGVVGGGLDEVLHSYFVPAGLTLIDFQDIESPIVIVKDNLDTDDPVAPDPTNPRAHLRARSLAFGTPQQALAT